MQHLKACHCCGLIHRLPDDPTVLGVCTRCSAVVHRPGNRLRSLEASAAAAIGALILFWPAVLLPIVRIDRLGYQRESSILAGSIELMQQGDWFVGGIIILFSVVFPLLKILLMIELCWLGLLSKRHQGLTYRIMEHAGRWSMMDVMLLAFMVMLVKLGDLMTFHFGPAVVAFVLCVTLSMLASIYFDPHSVWHDEDA